VVGILKHVAVNSRCSHFCRLGSEDRIFWIYYTGPQGNSD